MVHRFSLQKQIIYFQEVLVPLGFSSILLTAPHQYTLYNHVCHKFMSGCLPAFFISWSLQQQCFLCDHSTNCLFFFPSFQVLCIIDYYELIFVCVLQRNRFLAFPWVLWSLFGLLFTLGVTIFFLVVWHGVSFILGLLTICKLLNKRHLQLT